MFDFPVRCYKEGKTVFYAPDVSLYAEKGSYIPSKAPVFYNPKMSLNRDIAVRVLQGFSEEIGRKLKVCIPMAGCGVRALRFIIETGCVESIIVNDINPIAVNFIEKNLELHGLREKARVYCEDANMLLSSFASKRERFDIIDLDPFGSPAPFLDSAIRALNSKGAILCTTATDMPLLCGSQPRACIRRYGSEPFKGEYCHEVAVRILISHAIQVAAKYDYALHPVISYYMEHHVRVYFRGKLGAGKADEKMREIGYLIHCDRCLHRELVKGFPVPKLTGRCPQCGGGVKIAGPLWCGPIEDEEFLRRIVRLAEKDGEEKREVKFLKQLLQEANAPPLYYNVHKISSVARISCPPIGRIIEVLRKKGFTASRTHFNPFSVKTNAPSKELLKLLREAFTFIG